ncbi:hypothetical protein ID853_07020 [Xenorhabdus sp. Vera]|uniref:hypothetical protein n=1 Tax=Xenorhabdus koppenhoeferi TaxID=351659 RepID=UPI0019AF280F|nr:hypothetical protein [Xenorhabdus sp. Vera]MBD2810634.1 hypothetical protein [Xenorhabdus sp. Vera]
MTSKNMALIGQELAHSENSQESILVQHRTESRIDSRVFAKRIGIQSDEKGDWSFKKDDILEVGFSIKAEASIRGGVRYGIINGYVNATATADAKGLIGFAPNPKNEKVLDLVYYHDGIKAMVNVELAFGVRKKGNANDEPKDKGINTNAEKEWVFQKPLSKEESTYRISLG